MVIVITFEGLLLKVLWRLTIMASITSIRIGDGINLHPLQLAIASLPVVACCDCA
jgi:hypothetical protein